MAGSRRLLVTEAAAADLEGLWEHIAADNPQAARDQVARILARFDQLLDFPAMGVDRSRLAPSLRSIVEAPYIVFYYAHDDRVEIARVLHGHRDIEGRLMAFLAEQAVPRDTD